MKETEILLVTDNNLDTVGGEQESIKVLLNSLNDKYHFALMEPGKAKNKIKNVQYNNRSEKNRMKFIIRNPFQFMSYYFGLYRLIKTRKPRVIHTQSQVSFFMVAFLKKMHLINSSIKLVHTDRGLYIGYNQMIQSLFLFLINELDTLVTTTKFNRKHWEDVIKRKEIELNYKVIPNTAGTIFEDFDVTLEKVPDQTFTVGFSGRYIAKKDWPLAINIIKELDQYIGDNLRIKIAMGVLDKQADKKTKEMYTELKTLLGKRFEGLINISLEEMDQFYYDIDLFILTSIPNTESFGRTIVEAMSRKTAVLTTNAGGTEEVVRNDVNVCYSLEEIIEKTLQLYNSPAKLEQEKLLNLKHVRESYSLENNIQKHIKLYDRLLHEKLRERITYDITYNSRL